MTVKGASEAHFSPCPSETGALRRPSSRAVPTAPFSMSPTDYIEAVAKVHILREEKHSRRFS